MKNGWTALSILFATMLALAMSVPSRAQEKGRAGAASEPTEKAVEELYKEVQGLRGQLEKNTAEYVQLQGTFQKADQKRKEELQSDLQLKQRTMERLSELVKDKEKKLFERATAFLAKHPESAKIRSFRLEAAFTMERYDAVLEDAPYTEKLKGNDPDLQVLWAQALDRTYRFAEALPRYEKAIKILPPDRRSFVMYQAAACAFNAYRFDRAQALFAELARTAPEAQKPRFDMMARIAAEYTRFWQEEQAIREKEARAGDNPIVLLDTDKGPIKLELFENQAPNTTANFVSLVESGFYDGLTFHRVIPMFMIQGGDPEGTGAGGPGYRFADECRMAEARKHFIGSLSMANSGPDTNGSQFFITTVVTWHLNGKHTVFGRVLEGQDVVNRIEKGDHIVAAKVLRKRNHPYVVKKL